MHPYRQNVEKNHAPVIKYENSTLPCSGNWNNPILCTNQPARSPRSFEDNDSQIAQKQLFAFTAKKIITKVELITADIIGNDAQSS